MSKDYHNIMESTVPSDSFGAVCFCQMTMKYQIEYCGDKELVTVEPLYSGHAL